MSGPVRSAASPVRFAPAACRRARFRLLLLLLGLAPLPLPGVTVLLFDFDDGAGGFLNAPAVIAPHLGATPWLAGRSPIDSAAGNGGKAINADHFDGGNSLGFRLSVASGFELDLHGYGFDERASATGPVRWTLTVGNQEAGSGPTSGSFRSETGPLNLAGGRGDLFVTLFADGGTHPRGTWRIDNFQLQGTVAPLAAPVPASASLLLSALFCLLFRARNGRS